mmetsp:Transcript_51598/g.112157  ORF Transcript_51598/g.112157 Transcript_51598/m.112157 type:complete len:219 (-) Transcript_51598:1364-2020(-)
MILFSLERNDDQTCHGEEQGHNNARHPMDNKPTFPWQPMRDSGFDWAEKSEDDVGGREAEDDVHDELENRQTSLRFPDRRQARPEALCHRRAFAQCDEEEQCGEGVLFVEDGADARFAPTARGFPERIVATEAQRHQLSAGDEEGDEEEGPQKKEALFGTIVELDPIRHPPQGQPLLLCRGSVFARLMKRTCKEGREETDKHGEKHEGRNHPHVTADR